jgi:hypothetical protein
MNILTKSRKIGQLLLNVSMIAFFVLVGLDVYIQLEAYFISKPFWRPPLLTGLVIAIAYLLTVYLVNQLIAILVQHYQLLTILISLISILTKLAYNLWIRRKKPDYIVITG